MIKKTRVFQSGNSQAVRLPKGFRFDDDEVLIRKEGNSIVIMPKPKSWKSFFENMPALSDDFLKERENEPPQVRDI